MKEREDRSVGQVKGLPVVHDVYNVHDVHDVHTEVQQYILHTGCEEAQKV